MVQEVRRIILSKAEIICAFDSYRRMAPQFLPLGQIIDCKPQNNGSVILMLDIPAGSSFHQTEITLIDTDVLLPIIRFCLENNIMLPKAGKKTIIVSNHVLALDVKLNMDTDEAGDFSTPLSMEHMTSTTSSA